MTPRWEDTPRRPMFARDYPPMELRKRIVWPEDIHHVVCPGCYPDPDHHPGVVKTLCGKDDGPRWGRPRYGPMCLECVTLYGEICKDCGT